MGTKSIRDFTKEMLAAREASGGRLPIGSVIVSEWGGVKWHHTLTLKDVTGETVKVIEWEMKALFRGLVQMDYHFWRWYVQANQERRAKLTFAPKTPAPQEVTDGRSTDRR